MTLGITGDAVALFRGEADYDLYSMVAKGLYSTFKGSLRNQGAFLFDDAGRKSKRSLIYLTIFAACKNGLITIIQLVREKAETSRIAAVYSFPQS